MYYNFTVANAFTFVLRVVTNAVDKLWQLSKVLKTRTNGLQTAILLGSQSESSSKTISYKSFWLVHVEVNITHSLLVTQATIKMLTDTHTHTNWQMDIINTEAGDNYTIQPKIITTHYRLSGTLYLLLIFTINIIGQWHIIFIIGRTSAEFRETW